MCSGLYVYQREECEKHLNLNATSGVSPKDASKACKIYCSITKKCPNFGVLSIYFSQYRLGPFHKNPR